MAHTSPTIDFFVNFQRLGVFVIYALAAKWILISYAAAYVALVAAEAFIQRHPIPSALTSRAGATGWLFTLFVLYLVYVGWTYNADAAKCIREGGVVLACSSTVPALLALCIIMVSIIDLCWTAMRRHPHSVTKLFSVFD